MTQHADAVPWVLSAHSETELRARAQQLHAFASAHRKLSAADVGLGLLPAAVREHRAVVAGDRGELIDGLAALAVGADAAGLVRGAVPGDPGQLAFVFP